MSAPFGNWAEQTFHRRSGADGLISPWVIKGARDGGPFAAYVNEILAPSLTPGTVVILDKFATHRNVEAAQALRQAGCWFLYALPHNLLTAIEKDIFGMLRDEGIGLSPKRRCSIRRAPSQAISSADHPQVSADRAIMSVSFFMAYRSF